MKKFAIFCLFTAATASPGLAAAPGCFTAEDLAWIPSIARAVPMIDTAHRGCVTGAQIELWKQAEREARRETIARASARFVELSTNR